MNIPIKPPLILAKMANTGSLLAEVFVVIKPYVEQGISTLELDSIIERELDARKLKSGSKGFHGYCHSSCISLNDEVVHGIPSCHKICKAGDIVKIDICASHEGYFADMARSFLIEPISDSIKNFVDAAKLALDRGIEKACVGNRVSDISSAIFSVVDDSKYGVVRDFAGHGIGLSMHEDPEILNYGLPGKGPLIKAGMAFAIEPMITMKNYKVYIASDGWTVKTVDGSLAMHIEDTVLVTEDGPVIITRPNEAKTA